MALLHMTDPAKPVTYPVMLQIGAMSVYPRLFDLGADDPPVTGPLFGAHKSFATVPDILPIDFKFAW
jgi:hypothetical protein